MVMLVAPNRLMNPASGSGVYNPNVVQFISGAYIRKPTNFASEETGASSFSCFVNPQEAIWTSGKTIFAAGGWEDGGSNERYGIRIMLTPQDFVSADSKVRVTVTGDYYNLGFANAGIRVFSISSGFNYSRNLWMHIMFSYSFDSYAELAINDVYIGDGMLTSDAISFFQDTLNCTVCAVQAPTDLNFYEIGPGKLASLWYSSFAEFKPSLTVDRRKFITSGLRPVNLGIDGTTPGQGQPDIYLPNTAAFITNNAGFAGNFAKVGTPTDVPGIVIAGQA